MIGSDIADKITKVSKNSQHNDSDTVTNENYKEIPKERYMSPEKRQDCWWNEINKFVRQCTKSTN